MKRSIIHPFTGETHEIGGDSIPPPPPPSQKSDSLELTMEDVTPWGYILENGYFARF